MGWTDIFQPRQTQQPQNTNTQQANPNNTVQNTVQNNNNGNTQIQNSANQNLPGGNTSQQPNGNGQNANQNQPANPLDSFAKMFDNPTTEADKPPVFQIDKEVMDKVVSSQDFMQGIDPELMQKATGGDVQSLMQLIQHTSRNAYRAAIEHGGVLTDKFVGSYNQYSNKQLPGMMRDHFTEQSLAANTPNFKHPVVKKQLTETAKRLQRLHPDASPQEIAKMAQDYLTELVTAITPEDPNKQQSDNKGEVDWDKFFD